ncbi:MAG: radical SAM protein [Bacteroidales bacterium]|nr:radical SAM protein [Bacteroidales bacterium]
MSSPRIPVSVVLELTYRCNHRCVFCSCPWEAPNSRYPKGRELELKEWISAIDRLYDSGVQSFSISGGEATLKDCMPDIVKYIHDEGIRRGCANPIVLISNGLAMKEEYLHLFKENDVHLSMSLPGYETFREHTGVDNADGVLRWFSRAKEIGLSTTLNVTVTRMNYHELFETLSMGLINGATSILLNRFLPGGRGLSHMKELTLSNEQINGMMDTAEEVLTEANRYGNLGTEVAICSIRSPERYKRLHVGFECAAARGFFVVDPAGKIRTCNHSPRVVGHVLEEPMISDVVYWNLFSRGQCKPSACNGCISADKCDCGCREVAHILSGSPLDPDCSLGIEIGSARKPMI